MRLHEIDPLDEAFNHVAKVVWTNNENRHYGTFRINNQIFCIILVSNDDGSWEIAFTDQNSQFANSGKSGFSSIKVFSVVINELLEWMKRERPEAVYFMANKEDGKYDLYRSMAKHLASRIRAMGYFLRFYKGAASVGDTFEFVRDKRRPRQSAAQGKPTYIG